MSKTDFDASGEDILGRQIGPYTLVRRLGMGGMAETFVAIRRGPSGFTQRVCLKLVLPFYREDQEFVSLFQREARLAAKLRHSNIVGVLDFGEIGGRSYMALELVDGVDLRVLLDAQGGQKLAHEQVALLGHDLGAALHHAHNPPRDGGLSGERPAAIIHRDISPSNVLISQHGEIMLSDFGVAKAVTGSSHQQSAVKGKIPYMSPEQLRLEPIDGRADLFGVGVVLFEALCGRRPYEGGHDPATIMLILQGKHQPLASLAPGAPPALCATIERLIKPDRDDRPNNAAELIELLDPFVPPPRVRRELGSGVVELCEMDTARHELPAGFGEQSTAHQSGVDLAEDDQPVSGIVDAEPTAAVPAWSEGGAPGPETVAENSKSVVTGPLPKRGGGRAIAALILSLLLATGGLIAWQLAPDSPVTSPSSLREDAPAGRPTAEPSDETPDETARTDPQEPTPESSVVESEPEPDGGPMEPSLADVAHSKPPEARPSSQPGRKAPPKPAGLVPATLTVVVYPWGDVWINGKPKGAAPLRSLSLKPGRYEIGAGQGEPTVSRALRLRPGEHRKLRLDVTR